MGLLDLFSLFILVVIIIVFLAVLLVLAWLPGHLAKQRHSPWAEAINVAGWIGILLPPIWMLALIWAFYRPRTGEGAAIAMSEAEANELAATVSAIAGRITSLENSMRSLVQRGGGTR